MTARRIRQVRKRLGLTQQEFARRLGVARVTVTRWENGTRRPSRIAAMAVRAALAGDTRAWQKLAEVSMNEVWDNPEDAVYDEWKKRYSPQAR